MLTAEQIAQADDLPRETVDVPEWGGEVILRSLTSAERDTYEQSLISMMRSGQGMAITPDLSNAKAKLVAVCLESAEGERMFPDAEKGAEILGKRNAKAVSRLFEVAQRLSGMTDADLEELEKN